MPGAHHAIIHAIMHDPRVLERFWMSVDRDHSGEECWLWRDKPSSQGGYSVFRVRSHSVSIARVAWYASTGEFPLRGRIRHSCGNTACVRPQHLLWELGQIGQRALSATSDGYASVAPVRSASLPDALTPEYQRAS
jgi:hypothetical protein